MEDKENIQIPDTLRDILSETEKIGFEMTSDPLTGSLLRTLAASKPSGHLLEIGTGTGVSTAWILDGMCHRSKLTTVENDERVAAIAQKHLDNDPRVSFHIKDAATFLEKNLEEKNLDNSESFDLIFADTWAGKYNHLEAALQILKVGGIYVIDDMLPQPNWPEGHAQKVVRLIKDLSTRPTLHITKLNWASGIVLATKLG